MAELYRVLKDYFDDGGHYDRMKKHIEDTEKEVKIKTNQRLARLQLQAQQPRLVVKADIFQTNKTLVRSKENATPDERLGDILSAWVDDYPMSRPSFGDPAGPSLPPVKSIGHALVNEGTEAPKPRLSAGEMRMLTPATGGLLHAGTASTTQGTIFPPQPLPRSFKETIEERYIGTRHHARHSPSATVSGT